MSKPFVHLHNHTEYSLLDGFGKIKDIVHKAKIYDMPAIAITDHGNMFGVINFYLECIKNEIKPIIGCELYSAPGSRFNKEKSSQKEALNHVLFLAKDNTGYKNLMRLNSLAYIEGFYYKPRIDKELISKYSEGLICLTSCMGGEIPKYILNNNIDSARRLIEFFIDVFGKDDFYIELQNHGLREEEEVLPVLVKLASEYGLKTVCSNDVHYLSRDDYRIHDALLCVQTGKRVEDTDRLKFSTNEFYLKTYDEMYSLFSEYPESLENTLEIAEKCNVLLEIGENPKFDDKKKRQYHFPKYDLPENFKNADKYLEHLCRENLSGRYKKVTKEVENRLKYELDIIKQMGFASYFLIVQDFIRFAKDNKIPVGPGRGSAAGSIVAYLLEITEIDPLKYNLLFERFLNTGRISMPDIDIDFCNRSRDRVIEYVKNKYGSENVAQIITFGTMKAKNAIRDIGRVLGVPLNTVEKITKLIPDGPGVFLKPIVETSKELKHMMKDNHKIEELLSIAQEVEGMPRHASVHPAGVVISDKPLTEYAPLCKDQKRNAVVTQFDMNIIELIGLLKMDFLALKTLPIIDDTLAIIEKKKNFDMDSLDDKKTYELISTGNTTGVFQLESEGMQLVLKNLEPSKFTDLIAVLALYRPGVLKSGMIDIFISRKKGESKIEYPHKKLEKILEETYGIIIYQEQVMQIANIMASYDLNRADLLRKAMGKKKEEVMESERESFVQGVINNGESSDVAEKMFALIKEFAKYGFNKSHSAAYAVLTYRTAYLKAHYPVEFTVSLLNNDINNTDKIALFIQESKNMEIEVLPPDINKSDAFFKKEGKSIRFGLAAIKNVGQSAIESAVAERRTHGDYKDLIDFCKRNDLRKINKTTLESLVLSGSFDFTGEPRAKLFEGLPFAAEIANRRQKDRKSGQRSLFEDLDSALEVEEDIELPDKPEFSENLKLAKEREVLGFYLSKNPLEKYEKDIDDLTDTKVSDLEKIADDTQICIAGIFAEIKKKTDRTGRTYVEALMDGIGGTFNVMIFNRTYEQYADYITENKVLLVIGRADKKYGTKVIVNNLIPIEAGYKNLTDKMKLIITELDFNFDVIKKLKGLLSKSKGKNTFCFSIKVADNKFVRIKPGQGFRININKKLINECRLLLGIDNVKVNLDYKSKTENKKSRWKH